jgi:hypothetical protein
MFKNIIQQVVEVIKLYVGIWGFTIKSLFSKVKVKPNFTYRQENMLPYYNPFYQNLFEVSFSNVTVGTDFHEHITSIDTNSISFNLLVTHDAKVLPLEEILALANIKSDIIIDAYAPDGMVHTRIIHKNCSFDIDVQQLMLFDYASNDIVSFRLYFISEYTEFYNVTGQIYTTKEGE